MTGEEALNSLQIIVRCLRRQRAEQDERLEALRHAQALLADVAKYADDPTPPPPTPPPPPPPETGQIVDPALTGSPRPQLPPENSHEAGVAGGPPDAEESPDDEGKVEE